MKKPFLAEIAKKRQIEAVKRGNVSRYDNLPVVPNLAPLANDQKKGKVRDQIAKEARKSGRTVSSVEKVLKSGVEDLKKKWRVIL